MTTDDLAAIVAELRSSVGAIEDCPNDFANGSDGWRWWQEAAEELAAVAVRLADAVDPDTAEGWRCALCGYRTPGMTLADRDVLAAHVRDAHRPTSAVRPVGNSWPAGWYPGTD